jgi:hypothetical protein
MMLHGESPAHRSKDDASKITADERRPLASAPHESQSREAGPEEEAELHELLAHPDPVLQPLPPCKRVIADLLLLGHAPAEIARALDVKAGEVYAVRAWLRRELRKP